MDAFLERFFPEVYRRMKGGGGERVSNYCRFDSQLLTAFTSSLYVAGLVSTFFASSVTARCGRRPSMIVAGVVIIAGAAIGGSAVHISMLILSRVLLGVGLGFGNQVSASLLRVWMLSPYTHVFLEEDNLIIRAKLQFRRFLSTCRRWRRRRVEVRSATGSSSASVSGPWPRSWSTLARTNFNFHTLLKIFLKLGRLAPPPCMAGQKHCTPPRMVAGLSLPRQRCMGLCADVW